MRFERGSTIYSKRGKNIEEKYIVAQGAALMETKNTIDTQATEARKNTRARLDELRELYNAKYVTESEFKVARVNILKEGGIDVVSQLTEYAQYAQEGEEEPSSRGSGCGCFIIALLLFAFIVLGISFFAAPYWPERFGGVQARVAREWFTSKSTDFIDRFFKSPTEVQVPDPISSSGERSDEDSSDIVKPILEAAGTEQTNIIEEPVTVPQPPIAPSVDHSSLPSLDMHILSLPFGSAEIDTSAEPDITVVEIQTPTSAEPNTISPGQHAENVLRGYVTAPIARIRSAPDTTTNHNVVTRGQTGDRFTVLEESLGNDGSRWYRIKYENGNKHGWIRGSLVKLEK